ncbi:hypothetical protein SGLAM104S_10540 [Streptomyces glaucescens]
MAKHKIVAPGNAEYAQNQSLSDFAKDKTGMVLWQTASATFKSQGMNDDEWGVAPAPVQSGKPGTGTATNSMVAGINMAVFKNTKNIDGAKKFVKFMTSDDEQVILNKAYGSIPPVKTAQQDPAFNTPSLAVLRETLATSATALPQVPEESQFETVVGTAVKELFADAAAGRPVTTESVAGQARRRPSSRCPGSEYGHPHDHPHRCPWHRRAEGTRELPRSAAQAPLRAAASHRPAVPPAAAPRSCSNSWSTWCRW